MKQANHKGGFVVKSRENKKVDLDNMGTMVSIEDYIEPGE